VANTRDSDVKTENLLKCSNMYTISCELYTHGILLLQIYNRKCVHSDVRMLKVKCRR
jgi:hypothetical protein